jgi:hypothetical protein
MAALPPARIVKTTLVVYVAALFATAPFTGSVPMSAGTPADRGKGFAVFPYDGAQGAPASDRWAGAHSLHAPAGVELDVVDLSSPMTAGEVAAAMPLQVRVISMVGHAADGSAAGMTVPDGVPVATAVAMLGPQVAATPVQSIAIARDGVGLAAVTAAFAGRLAPTV